MITHSEQCQRRWYEEFSCDAVPVNAWHITCDETCFSENHRNKAGDLVSFPEGGGVLIIPKEVARQPRSINMMDDIYARTLSNAFKETSMTTDPDLPMFLRGPARRIAVTIVNSVLQEVRLDDDTVLMKEDRHERVLFFESKEDAEAFIGSLAEPEPKQDTNHWGAWVKPHWSPLVDKDGMFKIVYGENGPHDVSHIDQIVYFYVDHQPCRETGAFGISYISPPNIPRRLGLGFNDSGEATEFVKRAQQILDECKLRGRI